MDLFENGIVKIDDIKYMARDVYGLLPKYCELKQIVLDFSYSSANVFSDITQLENPIFVTSVMVSSKSKGSKVYISASADNVENEKAFEVGNGDVLDCGALWRFIQLTGDNSGGDNVQLIVTGYELGYSFEPIPIEKEYIEGYAVQVGGEYPTTITIRINSNETTLPVNELTGYYRYTGSITSLRRCLYNNNMVRTIKVHTAISSIDLSQFARLAENLEEVDMSYLAQKGTYATDTYIAFGLFAQDYDAGKRLALRKVILPCVTQATVDSTFMFVYARNLTDVTATIIANSISFQDNPLLTLQSAISVLSALQDLQGGTKTITFSSSTRTLIQSDTDAMNLVAQAQSFGWTITGF